jgi:hypothetical protein
VVEQERDRDALLSKLQRKESAAKKDLAAAAGDASLCVIAKSGGSFPAVKYHEGRAAALADVRRLVSRGSDLETAIVTTRKRWSNLSALAAQSPDWAGYVQGAEDALDAVDV